MTNQADRRSTSRATISSATLAQRSAEAGLSIIDVRSLPAYNGWRLRGESRGGHVPGAVAFPAEWLATIDATELERLLLDKGIARERTLVLVGDDVAQALPFASWLASLGYDDVVVLEGGFQAWVDAGPPVESLAKYDKLVYPEWVRQLIEGESPATYGGAGFVVLHVNFGVPEEYTEGHLPGAVYLDTNWLEDPVTWNRRSPAEIEATLLRLGIAPDTTVVVYGRDTVGDANEKWPGRRAGQIAATRAALILRYAGVTDVRLLDGGYDRWIEAGLAIDTIDNQPAPP
ncbi:MAG TPA: rhodanese-like domain-containing protein [Candidatus Saccharimonadia bacterium]|nr:rhodanese-like domain-containing protein [Candidatus Saccharimonadia bacterium]